MSKRVPLSQRIRPNSEAAPWVCEEVKKLEAELEDMKSRNAKLRAERVGYYSNRGIEQPWLSIDTAPTDGTHIDTYCIWAHLRETNVHFNGKAWVRFVPYDGYEECYPTHWRPIPKPPKGDER